MGKLGTVAIGLPLAAVVAITTAACGRQDAPQPATEAATVTVSDAWVKATDAGMTAAFGDLANSGDTDATLVGATTTAADMVEVHEVAMVDGEMVMQPKEGGVTIPAGGHAALEPGADHLMLMSVTSPITPGEVVTLTLEFSDGSTLAVDATAKHFTGGNEEYSPGHG